MKKYHIFEALCSFFIVGLGQIIKGKGKKGLNLLLIFYFALPAALYVSLIIKGPIFMLALPCTVLGALAVWLYSIIETLLK